MNVAISFSKDPPDIWNTKAENYRSLVARLRELNPQESVVIQHLTMAGFFGGISLDTEFKESPELTERIVRLLIEAAKSIKEEQAEDKEESSSISELLLMLEKFQTFCTNN